MKSSNLNHPPPKLGEVFCKRFYVVGIAPHDMPGCFAICGSGGIATSSSHEDRLKPTIGTDKLQAEQWFQNALEVFRSMGDKGDLILLEFTDGRVIKMEGFNGNKSLSS